MANQAGSGVSVDQHYYGKILTGDYSEQTKARVAEQIRQFQAVDALRLPVISYLAAWDKGQETLWYEFVCRNFQELMGCEPAEVAGAFRNSVLDRRVYKYVSATDDVDKESLGKVEISGARKKLRQSSKKEGHVEAIYKILLEQGRAIWLKDQARIETIKADNLNLSIGCMSVVSKEIEATEESERLIKRLEKKISGFKASAD